MKIALPQRFHKYYDKQHNFEIIKGELNRTDADLLVFPELFLTGYRIRDKITELAEPINGKFVKNLAKLAKKNNCALIFGMPESDSKMRGRIYNSAVFIDKKGKIGAYRKFHLVNFGPFEDKRYFHEGNELPIFQVDDTKLGIIICFEFIPMIQRFFEIISFRSILFIF